MLLLAFISTFILFAPKRRKAHFIDGFSRLRLPHFSESDHNLIYAHFRRFHRVILQMSSQTLQPEITL